MRSSTARPTTTTARRPHRAPLAAADLGPRLDALVPLACPACRAPDFNVEARVDRAADRVIADASCLECHYEATYAEGLNKPVVRHRGLRDALTMFRRFEAGHIGPFALAG